MAKEEKKAPKLRFNGYTNDWEHVKPKKYLKISKVPGSNGLIAKKLTVKLWGKGVVEKDTTFNGSENTKYFTRKSGQLMYGKLDFLHAAFGIVPQNLNNYESTADSPAFDINDVGDRIFLINYFLRPEFYLKNGEKANGSRKAKRIHEETFLNMPMQAPIKSEQEKIAKTLNSLNNTIQLHEDHLQFLHSFKSFLLQKMFFDNDIPPLLRFNKFTEKWNQCRLNDHTIVTMGQSPNSKNYTNNQTGKILVQGNADLYKNKVLKRVFTTEVTKTAVKNDILISVRAPVGDIARNQYESVVIGRGIASIKGNDFLYYQLEKMKNNGFWNKYIAGSTFESITGKDLKNTKIYTTNSDEERKIGNIFSSLTKIIQLQEHKIDSLKKLKQFLLQNMFI